MATRRPLVVASDGLREIPSGDLVAVTTLPVGAVSGTIAAGDDSRLSGAVDYSRLPLVTTPPVTLTYASTLTPDASAGNFRRCALTGSPTLAEPTSGTDGQRLLIEFSAAAAQTVTLFTRRLTFILATLPIGAGALGYVFMIYRSGTGWVIMGSGATG